MKLWTIVMAGKAWGVSRVRVFQLIQARRVKGAYRLGGTTGPWVLPAGTAKPRTRGGDSKATVGDGEVKRSR